MRKIYNTYLTIILLVFASCADDELVQSSRSYKDGEQVQLSFTISVPEEEEVTVTRATATENDVDNLTLLVFSDNTDSGTLEQVYTSYNYDGEFSETGSMSDVDDTHKKFTATVEASTESKAIYVLANAGYLLFGKTDDDFNPVIGTTTIAQLRALQTTSVTSPFIMSGYNKSCPIPHASLITEDFPLYRCNAKVTVEVADDVKNFTLESFYLCNANRYGSVLGYYLTTLPAAPDYPVEEEMDYSEWLDFDEKTLQPKDGMQYPGPTQNIWTNRQSKDTRVFLLIKGQYTEEGQAPATYYYHADFKLNDSPLNVQANHHYKVTITKVDRIGYHHHLEGLKGAIAAAENITTNIQDINQDSRNMASDGISEVSVENDTIWVTDADATSVEFDVTVSPTTRETGNTVQVIWDDEDPWLASVAAIDESQIKHYDDYSVVPVRINFRSQNHSGERREARVGISYRGVMTYVTIVQSLPFVADRFGKVTVTVKEYERGDDWVIDDKNGISLAENEDYWEFIRGNIYGISPEAMGGKVRTEGFHAPMSDYQQFIYTFTLPNGGDYAGCSWRVELDEKYNDKLLFWIGNSSDGSGDKNLRPSGTDMTGQQFTFTNDVWNALIDGNGNIKEGENAYRYGEDAFRIVVTHPATAEREAWTETFSYDLYHTGVFNYDEGNSNYRVGSTTDPGWYYYEVILMGRNYWLDRNLGAKSSAYYMKDTDLGSEWPYSDDAAGGLYSIADAPSGTDVQIISKEKLEAIAPKGFRIPYMSEFQALASDSRFRQEFVYNSTGGGYWDASYRSGTDAGTIYFPKNGLWYGGSAAGTDNTGYYWTLTEALGASGTERGYWLQSMQLSGSNASAGRYRIFDSGSNGNRTGMSVRCVYDSRVVETVHEYTFYVKGYTHVFLYNLEEDGSRTYLNTWPGDMITIKDDNALQMYHTFSFSSVTNYQNLHVVFNVVENGEIRETWPNDYPTNEGVAYREGQNETYFDKKNNQWSNVP